MNSIIIYNNRQELRDKPKNLNPKDIKLFQHEYDLQIAPVIGVQLRDISIVKNLIFSLSKFKFHLVFTHVFPITRKSLYKRLTMFLGTTQKLESGIWITDELSSEYFHWFTDALTRLKAVEYSKLGSIVNSFKEHPYVVLPESYKQKEYITSSIRLLGYEAYYYNPKRRLKVGLLTTCSHTAPMGNYNSEIIKEIRKALLIRSSKSVDKKIYISRSKAIKRKVTNDAEIIELLTANNFEVHNFEDYSFEQQLEVMSNVKTLIGMHGAGLTNMLFMPANGNVLELRNEDDSHNNCYFSLTSALNHQYFYLNNKGDRKDTNSVNITVNLEDLKSLLARFNS